MKYKLTLDKPNYQPAAMPSGYTQPTNGHYGSYGSVQYPSNGAQEVQSMDTRRRAIEALNDFLGDIKRRAIDPSSYYDVGSRLQSNSLPLPVGNGYNTGYSNPVSSTYSNSTTASLLESFNQGSQIGGGSVGLASQNYALPLPNARTKGDLQEIDRFLEQLQATVYETSNHAAAAGVQLPGTHSTHTGDWGMGSHSTGQFRSSNSPPNYYHGSSMGPASAMSSGMNMPSVPSTSLDTPALTPAASDTSYATSGQSPMSSHSRASLGSYPNLPSVTGMSDLGAGYPTTTSAPASGLASAFDGMDGRRYSGGRLQRQAPTQAEDSEMADVDDGSRTPKASEQRAKSKVLSSIDPALRGEDEKSPSDTSVAGQGSDGGDDKRQEEWVENIRVIEALKKWVSDRLKNGEYEGDEEAAADGEADAKAGAQGERKSSMEIAKMVEEKLGEQKMADIDYPSLPAEA